MTTENTIFSADVIRHLFSKLVNLVDHKDLRDAFSDAAKGYDIKHRRTIRQLRRILEDEIESQKADGTILEQI